MNRPKQFTNNALRVVSLITFCFGLLLAACSATGTSSAGASVVSSAQRQVSDGSEQMVSASGGTPPLGVVVDEQLVVLAVEPGSTAEQAGVQLGDRLVSLGDLPIADNRDKVKEMIYGFVAGDKPLALKVSRDNKEMTLAIDPSLARPVIPVARDGPPPTATPVMPPNDYF